MNSLNPYCNGYSFRTEESLVTLMTVELCLNPYCNGYSFRTRRKGESQKRLG